MTWYTETDTGLTYDKVQATTLSFEQYESEWDGTTTELNGKQWKVADLYLFGEQKFGERAAQVIDARKISRRRLANYVWVARKFSGRRRTWRRKSLSFSHHEAVAGLIDDPDHPELTQRARELLELASEIGLSVQDLEDQVAEIRGNAPGSANPLGLIQQAQALCQEAQPLVSDDARLLLQQANKFLTDAGQVVAADREFEGVTRGWFPE